MNSSPDQTQKHEAIPKSLPVVTTPEKVGKLEDQHILEIIDNFRKIGPLDLEQIQGLNSMIRELENDLETAEGQVREQKMKSLLEKVKIRAEVEAHYKSKISYLHNELIASSKRIKKLKEKFGELVLVNEDKLHDLEKTLALYEQQIKTKDAVLKNIIDRYNKDIGKKREQPVEQVHVVETLMDRNKEIEKLRNTVRELEASNAVRKSPPAPDIEITDDGGLRVNLSSVRVHEPKKVTNPTFWDRTVGKFFKRFGDK
jgi:hypothetical protein